jgi:hypothetical protein
MNIQRRLLLAALVAVFALLGSGRAQAQKRYALYCVAFYNLENLFDTIHDVRYDVLPDGQRVKVEDKNDYEYLPDGANKWDTMKYTNKLKNMSLVLSKLAADRLPMGPAIIGVSEIENRRVLEDLVKEPSIAARNYGIIHEEGPDRRGVDCAFLYNPRLFKYDHHKLVQYVYPPEDSTHFTRGFLIASGQMAGEDFHFIVNHWPSRGATSPARERAGVQVRALKDSLLRENPAAKIVIMGDLNDDPDNKSLVDCLGAKRKAADCQSGSDLWNPWWDTLRKNGVGTLKYNGNWNLFDQIIVNGNLLGDDLSTLKYYRHEVFQADFLMQQDGKFKGYPLRTHASGVWLNGYSDHLPSMLFLRKEVQ